MSVTISAEGMASSAALREYGDKTGETLE